MSIKLIRNDNDLTNAFIYLESIFQAEKNSPTLAIVTDINYIKYIKSTLN